MITSMILETELQKSHEDGHVTDNLLNVIESIIYSVALKKKEQWNQSDEVNEDMIMHSIGMYESLQAEKLVEIFQRQRDKTGLKGDVLLTYVRTSIHCTFTNFLSKRSRGLV